MATVDACQVLAKDVLVAICLELVLVEFLSARTLGYSAVAVSVWSTLATTASGFDFCLC